MPASRLAPDEMAITTEQNVPTVEGRKAGKAQREFLYQDTPTRPRQTVRPPRRMLLRRLAVSCSRNTRCMDAMHPAPLPCGENPCL
jgi:hypothetical protein